MAPNVSTGCLGHTLTRHRGHAFSDSCLTKPVDVERDVVTTRSDEATQHNTYVQQL